MVTYVRRSLAVALILVLAFVSLAFADENAAILDFMDAASFEKALNNGENVTGKTVRFEVVEYHPTSMLGYNSWAGEHLNFLSENDIDAYTGSIIDGRVIKFNHGLGEFSWHIHYEVLNIDNSAVNGNVVRTYDTMRADEVIVDGRWVKKSDEERYMEFYEDKTGIIHFHGVTLEVVWELVGSSTFTITPINDAFEAQSFMYRSSPSPIIYSWSDLVGYTLESKPVLDD